MKKFRTVVSLVVMLLAGVVGFFIGSTLENAFGGAILFSLIVGIACVVYAIDNRNEQLLLNRLGVTLYKLRIKVVQYIQDKVIIRGGGIRTIHTPS